MKNMAEFFPILMYHNGVLSRINGSKHLVSGSYALLPLFSVNQKEFFNINYSFDVSIENNRIQTNIGICSIELDKNIYHIPDPCFLVARRYGEIGYTAEEVESINKIWNKLVENLENEGWY